MHARVEPAGGRAEELRQPASLLDLHRVSPGVEVDRPQLLVGVKVDELAAEGAAMLRTKEKDCRIGGRPGSCARKENIAQEIHFGWATAQRLRLPSPT